MLSVSHFILTSSISYLSPLKQISLAHACPIKKDYAVSKGNLVTSKYGVQTHGTVERESGTIILLASFFLHSVLISMWLYPFPTLPSEVPLTAVLSYLPFLPRPLEYWIAFISQSTMTCVVLP